MAMDMDVHELQFLLQGVDLSPSHPSLAVIGDLDHGFCSSSHTSSYR